MGTWQSDARRCRFSLPKQSTSNTLAGFGGGCSDGVNQRNNGERGRIRTCDHALKGEQFGVLPADSITYDQPTLSQSGQNLLSRRLIYSNQSETIAPIRENK